MLILSREAIKTSVSRNMTSTPHMTAVTLAKYPIMRRLVFIVLLELLPSCIWAQVVSCHKTELDEYVGKNVRKKGGVSLTDKQSTSQYSVANVLFDTTCYIKTMADYKIKQIMDSLALSKKPDECRNGFAVEVMRARLALLREISRKYYANNTMENIRCILHNLYCLTGIKPHGDGDLFGYTFISSHTVTQYEEWLESNKERLCIDLNTRILFVPHE